MDKIYIDTSVQKAGIPGFSGCLEHSSVLWQLIKEAKKGQKNVAAVWLDLANAYGSFSHKLVWSALELYIIMPGNVQERVKSLFPEEHRSGFHHILVDGRENHRIMHVLNHGLHGRSAQISREVSVLQLICSTLYYILVNPIQRNH